MIYLEGTIFFIFIVYLHSAMKSIKLLLSSFSLLLFFCVHAQSIPSPEAFLGYRLGEHFTPHYKIVNYFKEVARTASEKVQLEQYGATYEGRPLLLAYIA